MEKYWVVSAGSSALWHPIHVMTSMEDNCIAPDLDAKGMHAV